MATASPTASPTAPTEDHGYAAVLAKMSRFGEVAWNNKKDELDYVKRADLTRADDEALIQIALDWVYREDWEIDAGETFAPIHAWRALGRLGAVEAIRPLMIGLQVLLKLNDDWAIDEFPQVFREMGVQAYEPLKKLTDDLQQDDDEYFARHVLFCAMAGIGERHESLRVQAVADMREELTTFRDKHPTYIGLLINDLIPIDHEHASQVVVEQAFAANQVDEQIGGGWGEVRHYWDAESLGIASDERRDQWWAPMVELRERRRSEAAAARQAEAEAKAKAKAKAKRTRKERKQRAKSNQRRIRKRARKRRR